MRFRTKLIITSLVIVIFPLALAFGTFLLFGRYIAHEQKMQEYSGSVDYNMVSDPYETFAKVTDELILEFDTERFIRPDVLEDFEVLHDLDEKLASIYSYIVVIQGDKIYYVDAANFERAQNVRGDLYRYGTGINSVYFTKTRHFFVRQYDFIFQTGEPGSLYIISEGSATFTKSLIIFMTVAIVFILLVTSILLTAWMGRSFFKPIDELNVAMQHIKDGNFDYMLPTDIKEKGEIGAIYRNYEDMRLRLKESAEEKIERERQNRELISNISHDLKTPITAIRGYSQGLMEGVAANPEMQRKYVKIIYNKANDMNNLINELTLYSSIDNNRIPYNFVKLNVAEYFGDCIEEIGADLESKSI